MFNKFGKLKIWRWIKKNSRVGATKGATWADEVEVQTYRAGCWGGEEMLSAPSIQQSWRQSPAHPSGHQKTADRQHFHQRKGCRFAKLAALHWDQKSRHLLWWGLGTLILLGRNSRPLWFLGRTAPGQGCTSQPWCCARGDVLPAKAGRIPHASAMACPPTGWAPTLDAKLPAWHPCRQHVK